MKDYLGNDIIVGEQCIICGNKYFENKFVRHVRYVGARGEVGISSDLESRLVRFTYPNRIIMLKNIKDNGDIND